MPPLRNILVAFLPLALCPLIACEGDDKTSPTAPSFDGGTNFDSSTSPLDGSPPPAAGGVTVTVLGNEGPRSGVLVVFHDASGTVLETKTTGADGKASATGATPAMVSALLSRGTERNIVTWTGIEPGDDLSVNDFDFFSDRGSYDVSLSGLFDGAASYFMRVGNCAPNGTPWDGVAARNIPLKTECVRAQNAVLVGAFDGDENVVAHGFVKNVAAPTGGTPLAVSVGGFVAPTDVVVSQTNGSTDAAYYPELTEVVGGVGYPSLGGSAGLPSTFRTATGFADAIQASVFASYAGGTARSLTRRIATPVPAGGFSFDFATAIPLVTAGTTDESDPRRPTLTWTTDAPITAADGGFVRFLKYLGGDVQLVWTLVVPPGATSVKAPALPAEADAWLPSGEATMNQSYMDVVFVESDQIPSYATFRKQQGTLFRSSPFDSIPALPTGGTLSISRWGNGG
jgi:hypothetical protein